MQAELRSSDISLFSLATLYLAVLMLSQLCVNSMGTQLLGADIALFIYAGQALCASLGYLLYALIRPRIADAEIMKLLVLSSGVGYGIAMLLLVYGPVKLFLPLVCVERILFGFLGGILYYGMAIQFRGNPMLGRLLGISVCVAVCMQEAVQRGMPIKLSVVICSLAIVLSIVSVTLSPPKGWRRWLLDRPENMKEGQAVKPVFPSPLLHVASVAAMTLLLTLGDAALTQVNAHGNMEGAIGVRLSYALSGLLAGFATDLWRRQFPLICCCAALLSPVWLAMLSAEGYQHYAAWFLYSFRGFYAVYLVLVFLELAPLTERPWLWAGMGRIVRYTCTGLGILPLSQVVPGWPFAATALNSALLIFLVIALGLNGELGGISGLLGKGNDTIDGSPGTDDRGVSEMDAYALKQSDGVDDALDISGLGELPRSTASREYIPAAEDLDESSCSQAALEAEGLAWGRVGLEYGMTPRECEVFGLLMVHPKSTIRDLADGMGISDRMFQRYLTSIYRKTNHSSRPELTESFRHRGSWEYKE